MIARDTALAALLGAGLMTLLAVPEQASAQPALTEQEAHVIGVQAYLYFYSLISVDITGG